MEFLPFVKELVKWIHLQKNVDIRNELNIFVFNDKTETNKNKWNDHIKTTQEH